MASLSRCIIKAGKLVSASDAARLQDAYDAARKEGYSETDAGLRVLADQQAEAIAELEGIAESIKEAGIDIGLKIERGEPVQIAPADRVAERTKTVMGIAKRAWGKKLIQALVENGTLNFITAEQAAALGIPGLKSAADVKGNQVKGIYHDGKAYVVTDVVSDKDVAGVILHEVGVHYGLPRMVGAAEFKSILYDLAQQRGSDPDIDAAFARVPADTAKAHTNEEALAYLAEANPAHALVQRLMEGIRRFLKKLGVPVAALSDNAKALRDMAVDALRAAATDGAKVARGDGVRFSGGDLFGAATSRESLDAATRAKDAKRNGATSGATMREGDGELFAGPRPEQGSLVEGDAVTRPDAAKQDALFSKDRIKAVAVKPAIGDPETLWSEANEFYRDNLQGTTTKAPDGTPVTFSSDGRKRAMSVGRRDPRRMGVVRRLRDIVATAPIYEVRGSDSVAGDQFAYAVAPVEIDGTTYAVKLTYSRPKNAEGDRFYTFGGFEIVEPGAIDPGRAAEAVLGVGGPPGSDYTLAQLVESVQEKPVFSVGQPTNRTTRTHSLVNRVASALRAPYESAVDHLRRSPKTKALGDSIAAYFDAVRRRSGEVNGILRPATLEANEDDLREFEKIMAAVQNGRAAEARQRFNAASQATKDLVGAWNKVANLTGDQNQSVGVKVYDAKLGGWRPIGRAASFWPRTIKEKYRRAMHDPEGNAKEWAEMVNILLAEGVIADPQDAEAFLNTSFNDETSDDYFAGIEKARGAALPEKLYDYSWEAAIKYKDAWAERISQIEHFGQKGPEKNDAFEKVIAGTIDKSVQEYVQRVSDVVYRRKANNIVSRVIQSLSSLATGLQLGNPASAIVNLVGGLTLTGQAFPVKSALRAVADMHKMRDAIGDAYAKGILVDDFFGLAADAIQEGVPEKISRLTTGLLKYGGFTTAEHFSRAFNLLTAKHYLRDSLKAWNENVRSRKSKLAIAWMQRNGFDYSELLREDGQGPETDRFLRAAVNQTQGSYRIDQTPAFIDEPLGRFLLKYQKFSTQVFRMFVRNHLQPFMDSIKGGEKVTLKIDGKEVQERVSNFMPMLRYFAMAVPGGMLAMGLRAVLFGYGESGPDDEEIKKAMANNETARALGMAAERAFAATLAIGAFGFVGNYAQALWSWQDRQRFKNPLNPPSLAPIDGLLSLVTKAYDQGKLTAADVDELVQNQWSMYRTGKRLAGTVAANLAPDSTFGAAEQARRDRAWARKMARRYADEAGIEAGRRAPDAPIYTENTPMNRAIKDALLVGDAERARAEAEAGFEGLRSRTDIDNMKASIQSSVRMFRPALVMESQSAFVAKRFMDWAKANLTAEGYKRLHRIDSTYMDAAKASGLWNWREVDADKEEAKREDMSEDEAADYIARKLKRPEPQGASP